MSSIVKKLAKSENNLIHPKHDFVTETVYEVIMGSMAYGVSNNTSDMDIYAVCIPNKTMVFPHINGYIYGFGPPPETFESYQKHHITLNDTEYDVAIYSLIKYFQLCYEGNPNMIDSLFVPNRCVLHTTDAGDHMRSYRKSFLSKRSFDKLRGYAYGEFNKLKKYNPEKNGKREQSVTKYGYDVKSAYHIVRLMLEAEMILHEGDLDLERHREQLKFVRSGGYSLKELENWFHHKERELTTAHTNSKLPLRADYNSLNVILMECLEMHFGSLDDIRNTDIKAVETLEQIKRIVNKV